MIKSFAVGLVVGKFAPLHYGHERLIRNALACCERTLVLSYSLPELPGYPPERRKKWLSQRFPAAEIMVVTPQHVTDWRAEGRMIDPMPPNAAPAEEHRRFVAQLCLHVWGTPVQAVFTGEDYGDGFAATLGLMFSSPVVHVRLDRSNDPRSGTRLRGNLHDNRHFLAPEIYADFVRRICLLGGESSGKSTLSTALGRHFETEYVAEYGRTLWEEKGGVLEYPDLLAIAREQVRREEAACLRSYRHVFCDTSPLTTLLYCLHMFGRAEPELFDLAVRPYDLLVLCAPDFPFVQDGTRRDESFRTFQHRWYLKALSVLGMPCLLVTGNMENRIAQIGAFLENG